MRTIRAVISAAAVAVIAATAVQTSAFAAPEDQAEGPVSLKAPADDLRSVLDAHGKPVKIVKINDRDEDEKTAVALTAEGEAVLLRSLYAPKPKTPANDAVEPGHKGWVEGVNYFTDGEPQTSEEVVYFDDLPQIDPATLDLALSTATTETSFSAAWAGNAGVTYEILRDGKLVDSTNSGSFTDSGLKPGRTYTYTARPAKGEGSGDEKTFQVHALVEDAEAVALRTSDPIAALAMTPVASWFMYNTFITNQYVAWDILQGVGGGCAGTLGDKFGGDNRSWYAPPPVR